MQSLNRPLHGSTSPQSFRTSSRQSTALGTRGPWSENSTGPDLVASGSGVASTGEEAPSAAGGLTGAGDGTFSIRDGGINWRTSSTGGGVGTSDLPRSRGTLSHTTAQTAASAANVSTSTPSECPDSLRRRIDRRFRYETRSCGIKLDLTILHVQSAVHGGRAIPVG